MVINMIYDHLVKHNGKYYAAGEEVPEDDFAQDKHEDETLKSQNESAIARRGRPKKG